MTISLSVAEWRNWQTHQTQNLAFFTEREGSTPSSATNLEFHMMAIRRFLTAIVPFAFLVLSACGEKPQMPADLFPAAVPGGWTLAETHDLGASDAPDPVPRNSIEQIRAATYKVDKAEIDARVYLLSSAEVGAALGTRWRPSADTVFFDHGEYFVVVKWQGADRQSVQQFVADLQKRLGAAPAKRP